MERARRPSDAGANPDGDGTHPLFPGSNDEANNDGALFCSDLTFLPDGRVLAAGGTAYYQDPEIVDTGFGVVELEGLRNSRIYDPATNRWSQTGSMAVGRWYPSLVTLGNGKVFVASGVEKLVKPIYPDHPLDSFANVRKTETYDPAHRQVDATTARRRRETLPLFPRLHLLPNGHVYYNAAGQAFNPFGQSYDEALWNIAASYDPATARWRDLGVPGVDGGSLGDLLDLDFGQPRLGPRQARHPGRRQEPHAARLPRLHLLGDAAAAARRARPLHQGVVPHRRRRGQPGAPSPGSYFSTSDARITTVDTGRAATRSPPSRPATCTGRAGTPRASCCPRARRSPSPARTATRWPCRAPSSRSSRPSSGIRRPATGRPVAEAHRPRTYHNTAVLLPDGRVLIGGHAPITTLYLKHITLPGGFSPNERDPSFELYSPPYLFRGTRPKIVSAPGHARLRRRRWTWSLDRPASEIESVVLVRNPTETHLVDDDQRNVVLRVVSRSGNRLTVATPPNGNVAPPGPYMLFANRKTASGLTPSVAKQITLR